MLRVGVGKGRIRTAFHAFHVVSNVAGPTCFCQHACPVLKRRLVAHVKPMPALEFGNPVACMIAAKAGDPAPH